MSQARQCLALLVAALVSLSTSPSRADSSRVMAPRIAVDVGVHLTLGPDVTTNGQPAHDPVRSMGPRWAAGFDVPLHPSLLMGARGTAFPWGTYNESSLGGDHGTLDLSLLAAYRISIRKPQDSEFLTMGLLGGPSLHGSYVPEQYYTEASSRQRVGFHVGPYVGFEELSLWSSTILFIGGSIVYHRFVTYLEYRSDGSSSTDRVVYQPVTFSFDFGLRIPVYL